MRMSRGISGEGPFLAGLSRTPSAERWMPLSASLLPIARAEPCSDSPTAAIRVLQPIADTWRPSSQPASRMQARIARETSSNSEFNNPQHKVIHLAEMVHPIACLCFRRVRGWRRDWYQRRC